MKKFACLALVVFALVLAAGVMAATKSYQFTGTVKSVDGNTFTVEKNAKETWTFETASDTKGAPKVGEKVTVNYKMVATNIEAKPATAEAKPKAPAKKK
jgi:small nuclear ribonucleoprotein (snRNP)-like protein